MIIFFSFPFNFFFFLFLWQWSLIICWLKFISVQNTQNWLNRFDVFAFISFRVNLLVVLVVYITDFLTDRHMKKNHSKQCLCEENCDWTNCFFYFVSITFRGKITHAVSKKELVCDFAFRVHFIAHGVCFVAPDDVRIFNGACNKKRAIKICVFFCFVRIIHF